MLAPAASSTRCLSLPSTARLIRRRGGSAIQAKFNYLSLHRQSCSSVAGIAASATSTALPTLYFQRGQGFHVALGEHAATEDTPTSRHDGCSSRDGNASGDGKVDDSSSRDGSAATLSAATSNAATSNATTSNATTSNAATARDDDSSRDGNAATSNAATARYNVSPSNGNAATSNAATPRDNATSKNYVGASNSGTMRVRNGSYTASNFDTVRQKIEDLIQYRFQDVDHLTAALFNDRISIGNTNLVRTQDHLATIGDSVYKTIYYVDHFPSATELTSMNVRYKTIATNVHFSILAKRHGLDVVRKRWTLGGNGESSEHGNATMVEAILGAVYLDSGASHSATRRAIDAMALGVNTIPSSSKRVPVAKAADVKYESQSTSHASLPGQGLVAGPPQAAVEAPVGETLDEYALYKRLTGPRWQNKRRLLRRSILLRHAVRSSKKPFTSLLRDVRALLDVSPAELPSRDQLEEIKGVLQTFHPRDRDYNAVKPVLERIEDIQRASGAISEEVSTAGAEISREASSESPSSLDGGTQRELTEGAKSSGGHIEDGTSATPSPSSLESSTEAPSDGQAVMQRLRAELPSRPVTAKAGGRRTGRFGRRMARKRVLLKYVPGATMQITVPELAKSITRQLQSCPTDLEIRENREEIERVAREYHGTEASDAGRELLKLMEKCFGPSPTARTEVTDDDLEDPTATGVLSNSVPSSDAGKLDAGEALHSDISQNGQDSSERPRLMAALKHLAMQRDLESKRVLTQHVPDATEASTPADLVQGVLQRLEDTPNDPEIQSSRREIERIVKTFDDRNTDVYELSRRLLEKLHESFGPSNGIAFRTSLSRRSKISRLAAFDEESNRLAKALRQHIPGTESYVTRWTLVDRARRRLRALSRDPRNGTKTQEVKAHLKAYANRLLTFERAVQGRHIVRSVAGIPSATTTPEKVEETTVAAPKSMYALYHC